MKIRLPADLKDKIEEASKVGGRSMNAEIVARLQQSFTGSIPPEAIEAIEKNASMMFAPDTPEFQEVVERLSKGVVSRSQSAAIEMADSLLQMSRMRLEAPDIFQKIIDAGREHGMIPAPGRKGE